MNSSEPDTLNREQLLDAVKKAMTEINTSYDEVSNTADLWEWAKNTSQENYCRSFAAGLAIARHLLTQALRAEISADKSTGLNSGIKSNAVSNKT